MDDIPNFSKRKSLSDQEGLDVIQPKEEIMDFEMPSPTIFLRNYGDNIASSSGSNMRSSLIGMGFLPSLVDKVIEEKGEDNIDLLVEALLEHPSPQNPNDESSDSLDSLFDDKDSPQNPNDESSDSLDSLFDDKDVSSHPDISNVVEPKEEPDICDASDGVHDEKRASLLMMKFSKNEVEFAIDKLGEDAPISDLVDLIVAAQIAVKVEKDAGDTVHDVEVKNEDVNDETLFGTMEKTLRLLEMGFSENQVSWAMEKFGPEAPISEVAEAIFADQTGYKCIGKYKYNSAGVKIEDGEDHPSYVSTQVKVENFDSYTASQSTNINVEGTRLGKRPKQEYADNSYDVTPQFGHLAYEGDLKGKRPKQESFDYSSDYLGSSWLEEKVNPNHAKFAMPTAVSYKPCKSLNQMVAKPPYFFYGNVANVSKESWAKVSQYLYAMEPEFVNTQHFSALNRTEGYIHNLPSENRFHILPKPPMTIEDTIPHTKKWWPSWDTRKQLSCINSETNGISRQCDRLGKMLSDYRGLLSSSQQRDILHHCELYNLVWLGKYKLGPMEPEYLERILGYPPNHTETAETSLTDRLQSLRYCFQTDTLGYHLSVLKSMYPGGLTLLTIFSGIGGAEVAVHRLGIRLKAVVSVESSELKRRILKRWWQNTGQNGELVEIEDIQKLSGNKIANLFQKFGGFDLIVCQNPNSLSSCSMMAPDNGRIFGFDFSFFCEFYRVLRHVQTMTDRRK